MTENKQINGFWSYLWAVVVKPWWISIVFGLSITAFGVFCTIRNELMPEYWQRRLATPHLQWRTWACIILIGALASVVRNGYEVWKEQQARLQQFTSKILPATAPEIEILPDREQNMGLPEALILRNASKEFHLHSICFQPQQLPQDVFVTWQPNQIPLLQAEDQRYVAPWVFKREAGDHAVMLQGVRALASEMLNKLGMANSISLGKFAFSCTDKLNNRYLVEAEVFYMMVSGFVHVGPIERKLIP